MEIYLTWNSTNFEGENSVVSSLLEMLVGDGTAKQDRMLEKFIKIHLDLDSARKQVAEKEPCCNNNTLLIVAILLVSFVLGVGLLIAVVVWTSV